MSFQLMSNLNVMVSHDSQRYYRFYGVTQSSCHTLLLLRGEMMSLRQKSVPSRLLFYYIAIISQIYT